MFQAGDAVYVTHAKKRGVVLRETGRGAYLVLIGNLQMRCREDQLRPAPGGTPAPADAVVPPTVASKRKAPGSIDLHGMHVDDALRAVESAINDCVLAGANQLEVIHGLGSGKIKNALHRMLADTTVVKSFRLDLTNPGITRVYF